MTDRLPDGRTFRPPALARAFSRGTRLTLVAGEDAVALRGADGDVHAIRYDDVEAVVRAEDGVGFTVVGRHFCEIAVHPDLYGRAAHEEVARRLAARVWVPAQPTDRPAAAPVAGGGVRVARR